MYDDRKYLVLPGFIQSKSDAEVHWISGRQLINLYGVDSGECVIADVEGLVRRGWNVELNKLIKLTPNYSGDYSIPKK